MEDQSGRKQWLFKILNLWENLVVVGEKHFPFDTCFVNYFNVMMFRNLFGGFS